MSHVKGRFCKYLFTGLIVLVLIIPASIANAQVGGWTRPIPVSGTPGSSYSPHLAIDNQGTLHMVWYDWVDFGHHYPYILYANKPAGGPWTPFMYLPGKQMGDYPAIAVDSNNRVHIVWASVDNDSCIKYVSRSVSGTWSTVQVISASTGNSSPDIAVGLNNSVHVVWNYGNVYDPGNKGIYYAFKPVSGSWSSPVAVYKSLYLTLSLIEVDSNNTLHVLIGWYDSVDHQVRYAVKPNDEPWSSNWLTFTPRLESIEQLTRDAGGNLHLVWSDNDYSSKCRLYYSSKPIGSAFWNPQSTALSGKCQQVYFYYPSITINQNGIPQVAWTSRLYINQKVVFSAWFAYPIPGRGWSSPNMIDRDLVVENASSILVDGSGVYHFVRDSGPAPGESNKWGEIFYTSLGSIPEPPIEATITPGEGGNLASLAGDVQIQFPPGAVPENVLVTYAKGDLAYHLPTGDLSGIKFIDLTAKMESDETPVNHFSENYMLTVFYDPQDTDLVIADTLVLRYWDWDNDRWVDEGISLDVDNKSILATPDHMTLFALLGETLFSGSPFELFLPLILR